jgi:Ca-activated chloride channel family protein
MIKLLPDREAAQQRPAVSLAAVIDTSGSMREPAPGAHVEAKRTEPFTVDGKVYNATFEGQTKLDVAADAVRALLNSPNLLPGDYVSIIQFDDDSSVLAEGTVGADRDHLLAGVEALKEHSGGTMMGSGLRNAVATLQARDGTSHRVLLLTDGRTVDEDECREAAGALAEIHAPIVGLGVGEEYNEDLLADLCNVSLGRPYDFRDMTVLPQIFESELGAATRQVVSDVQLTARTVRDVRIVSAMRVYPTLADLDVGRPTIPLGNIEAGDYTIFILELDLPSRPAVRTRLAQIGITYLVPARQYRGEIAPQDIVVEFTWDETLANSVDPEVMGYIQQRNIDNLVRQATVQAATNPEQAAKTLGLARSMTQRLGNHGMTLALAQAEEELRGNGTIRVGTVKTIKLGARTQTMKVGSPDDVPDNIPSEEEIRKLTGA